MAEGVAPVEWLFAFVALADVVYSLPLRTHGETAGRKAIECFDQPRKIIVRHNPSSLVLYLGNHIAIAIAVLEDIADTADRFAVVRRYFSTTTTSPA